MYTYLYIKMCRADPTPFRRPASSSQLAELRLLRKLLRDYYNYYYYYQCDSVRGRPDDLGAPRNRLRTGGVNTNGAAEKAMNLNRLRKKARPGTFSVDKNIAFAVTPLALTPFVPFFQNSCTDFVCVRRVGAAAPLSHCAIAHDCALVHDQTRGRMIIVV